MPKILFITGSSGFIGKPLVSRLLATGLWQIRALTRRPPEQSNSPSSGLIVGNLCDAETYRSGLEGVDTVVHLAAITGKAAPSEYERTNFEGTKIFLQACKAARVKRFLHVSTIAVTYSDQRHYGYAQSKARAEALVRECGIPYTIIRPTVVIGSESPIWRTLSTIAKLPVVPLPNGGRVQLQPIDVGDLVRGIELVVSEGRFDGEALDLGGPSVISFADFMRTTHKAFYGKDPHFIYFPLAPVRSILAFTEPMLRRILPVTAGQLALFANNSTADPNWLQDILKKQMHSLAEMIVVLGTEKNLFGNPATAELSSAIGPRDAATINRECEVFTHYLVSQPPTDYIRKQYKMATLARDLANDSDFTSFDRAMLRYARRHVFLTRVTDAYCAIFHRHSILRRKLILLLAILEHASPTAARFDRPRNRGLMGISADLLLHAMSFGLSLIAGIVLLLPSYLFRRSETKHLLGKDKK